jgi:hypothetical protein
MRSASILSALFLAGMLLFAPVAAVLGEDRPEADPARSVGKEWRDLANGRSDFDVSDPALLPGLLALAAEQSGCNYIDVIKEVPVRFISVDKRRLALVLCQSGINRSHQVFDLSNLRKPKRLELPFLARPDGFGTTATPGAITWNREAGVFQAEIGTDLCPSARLRHTYRLAQIQSSASFVIIRVEVQREACSQGEWTTIWDAPQWALPTKPGP